MMSMKILDIGLNKREGRAMGDEKTIYYCSLCHSKSDRISTNWGFCPIHGLMSMSAFEEASEESGAELPEKKDKAEEEGESEAP